jgi:hypothetical protein
MKKEQNIPYCEPSPRPSRVLNATQNLLTSLNFFPLPAMEVLVLTDSEKVGNSNTWNCSCRNVDDFRKIVKYLDKVTQRDLKLVNCSSSTTGDSGIREEDGIRKLLNRIKKPLNMDRESSGECRNNEAGQSLSNVYSPFVKFLTVSLRPAQIPRIPVATASLTSPSCTTSALFLRPPTSSSLW